MSRTEIYYFSGTGNSLHAARELQKRLPEANLKPMVGLINQEAIAARGETAGFVFPVYRMVAPMIVKEFIRKADLSSTRYLFAVVTRGGTACDKAIGKIQNLLAAKGKSLDAYMVLNMASNDPKAKGWKPASARESEEMEAENQKRLDLLAGKISNQAQYRERDTRVKYHMNPLLEHIGALVADASGYVADSFYHDAKCTGCGVCATVCPAAKIRMAQGEPVWQKEKNCYSCDACINFCPARSIQIRSNLWLKSYTEENGRYTHPEITATDMAQQKCL